MVNSILKYFNKKSWYLVDEIEYQVKKKILILGKLITGCNVENASYGLSICAERTACVKALSEVGKLYTRDLS